MASLFNSKHNKYVSIPDWFKDVKPVEELKIETKTTYIGVGGVSSISGLSNITIYNKFVLKDAELDNEALIIKDIALNGIETEEHKIGDEIPAIGWNTTEYTSIAGSSTMTITSAIIENQYGFGVFFYDNTLSYISNVVLLNTIEEVIVPANAYYFRISVPANDESFNVSYNRSESYNSEQLALSDKNVTDYLTLNDLIPEGKNETVVSGNSLKLLVQSPLSLTKDINNVVKLSIGNIIKESSNDMFVWDKKLAAFGYDDKTGMAYSYVEGEQLFTTDDQGNQVPVTTDNPEFWMYNEALSDKWIIKSTKQRLSLLDGLIEYDNDKDSFIFHKNIITSGGITMYADLGNISIPNIYDGFPHDNTIVKIDNVFGVPIDNDTIVLKNGKLTVQNGTGNSTTFSVKIWGNEFDGKTEISGNISNVGDISFLAAGKKIGEWGLGAELTYSNAIISKGSGQSLWLVGSSLTDNNGIVFAKNDKGTRSDEIARINSIGFYPYTTGSLSLGTVEKKWNNVYSKKTTIDDIELYQSLTNTLFVDGNLVVSGGITMYGTDGTTAPSIWEGAPKATTSDTPDGKGIASFDSKSFSVTNGHVSFIGNVGGLDESALASYLLTNKYLTQLSGDTMYLSITGNAATSTKVHVARSANTGPFPIIYTDVTAIDSNGYRSLYCTSKSGTGYNPSTNTFVCDGVTLGNGMSAAIKTKGWYRFATTINAEHEAGGSLIFSIRRQYNNYHTESYVVAVTVGYSGVTFTQLSGKHRSHRSDIASHAMITQVRATNYSDSQVCFDFFYEGTSNEHKVYINCVGTVTLQVPTLTTDVRSYTTVFDLSNGLKVDEIYSNSYRDIAYIRRKFGVNLLTNGDTSISANNYLVGSYQCNSTVVEGRTYRLTFCGKLGEENTYLSLLSNNGNTYIRDVLGLSRTEEKIVSFTFKMKGDQPLRFYQYPNGKFGSYIRWAYLEEAYNEGELITTTDYNNWLAEYNKLDARSFLYKIQQIDVGDSSYWSADKGLNLIDVNEYALTMKRTTSSGGTFIKMFANNQSTQSWASGVNDAHQFSWKYQNGTSDIQKMYIDSSGSLYVKGSYYIDSSAGTGAGYALHGTQSPDVYGMLMGTRSSFGTHGGVTGGWATYFCMNGYGEARGWVFRNSYNRTNVASITTSGDMLVNGGITMYSDLRKKTILNHVELSLKEVADAPLIEHYYNSDEAKTTHVGSVALYWAGLNDWFCKEDGEGFLTMEILNAALASAISVARELTRYESKTDKLIRELKEEIKELKKEIEQLKMA